MVDSLARQALSIAQYNQLRLDGVFPNATHVHDCPVITTLQSVTINNVTLLQNKLTVAGKIN